MSVEQEPKYTPETDVEMTALLAAEGGSPDDLLRTYLDQANKYPSLTAEQEVELAQKIHAGHVAEEMSGQNDVSDATEQLVVRGRLAREQLINSNLFLVVSIAREFAAKYRNIPILDFIQEGNMGLMRAADRFDPNRSYKFSTYAVPAIWDHMDKARMRLGTNRPMARVAFDELTKFRSKRSELSSCLQRQPTDEEVRTALDVDAARLAELKGWDKYSVPDDSIFRPVGQYGDQTLANMLPGDPGVELDDMEQGSRYDDLLNLILQLPEPQQSAFRAVHGIDAPRLLPDELTSTIKRHAREAQTWLAMAIEEEISLEEARQKHKNALRERRGRRSESMPREGDDISKLINQLLPAAQEILLQYGNDPAKFDLLLRTALETINFDQLQAISTVYGLNLSAEKRIHASNAAASIGKAIAHLNINIPALFEGRWSDLDLGRGGGRARTPLVFLIETNQAVEIFERPEQRRQRALDSLNDTSLNDEEKQIVALLFGLHDGVPLTVSKAAESLGLPGYNIFNRLKRIMSLAKQQINS